MPIFMVTRNIDPALFFDGFNFGCPVVDKINLRPRIFLQQHPKAQSHRTCT